MGKKPTTTKVDPFGFWEDEGTCIRFRLCGHIPMFEKPNLLIRKKRFADHANNLFFDYARKGKQPTEVDGAVFKECKKGVKEYCTDFCSLLALVDVEDLNCIRDYLYMTLMSEVYKEIEKVRNIEFSLDEELRNEDRDCDDTVYFNHLCAKIDPSMYKLTGRVVLGGKNE